MFMRVWSGLEMSQLHRTSPVLELTKLHEIELRVTEVPGSPALRLGCSAGPLIAWGSVEVSVQAASRAATKTAGMRRCIGNSPCGRNVGESGLESEAFGLLNSAQGTPGN